MSTAKEARLVDPIISWPSVTAGPLRSAIADLQRLNPGLGLRCAISTWKPDYANLSSSVAENMRKRLAESEPSEYLVYEGTAHDVVTIVMPDPPSDDSMSGFTDLNREGLGCDTNIGQFKQGPRRIERTAAGNLLIRPRSEAIERIAGYFAAAYQGRLGEGDDDPNWLEHVRRLQSRWGIFHDPHELWEVEFAWFDDDFLEWRQSDHTFWRTTPIGTISYIDRYDLPIAAHFARAREIVAAGSEFAIVGDVDAGELRVFRMSGIVLHLEDVRLPEWPWFDVPVRARWKD